MCYPPMTWQTYDIEFTAAQWENGKKAKNAVFNLVRHNGVVVHKDQEVTKVTTAAPVATIRAGTINLQESRPPGPLPQHLVGAKVGRGCLALAAM